MSCRHDELVGGRLKEERGNYLRSSTVVLVFSMKRVSLGARRSNTTFLILAFPPLRRKRAENQFAFSNRPSPLRPPSATAPPHTPMRPLSFNPAHSRVEASDSQLDTIESKGNAHLLGPMSSTLGRLRFVSPRPVFAPTSAVMDMLFAS